MRIRQTWKTAVWAGLAALAAGTLAVQSATY
jgi:hypothetical protein